VRALQAHGTTSVRGEENLGGRQTELVEVEGEPGAVRDGVHRYRLWLDAATRLPLKAMAYGPKGELVDEARMDGLEVNPPLGDELFAMGTRGAAP